MRALQIGDKLIAAKIKALNHRVVEIEYRRRWHLAETERSSVAIILDGVASKAKVARDGGRQLLSFDMPGDILNVGTIAGMPPKATIEAITHVKLACIATADLRAIAEDHPAVAHAAWVYTEAASQRAARWIANLARRNARARLAYILCELTDRQEAAGLGDRTQLVFPLTQIVVADALALTPVHLSRTFSAMVADGLLAPPWPCVGIPNWPLLASIGDYNQFPGAVTGRHRRNRRPPDQR